MQTLVRSIRLLESQKIPQQGFKALLSSVEMSMPATRFSTILLQSNPLIAPAVAPAVAAGGLIHARWYAKQQGPQGAYQQPLEMARPSSVRVPMISSGLLAEPYKGVPPPLPLTAWFTPTGWRARWKRWVGSFKSIYCISKCKKHIPGWTLPSFKQEALDTYREVCAALAAGDRTLLRQLVSPVVFSDMKKQLKRREEGGWVKVIWDMPEVPELNKIEVVHGRLIAIDPKDDSTGFAQLTVRFRSGQVFAAYDARKRLVAGNPDEIRQVEDFWVFERPMKKQTANRWRLAGILTVPPARSAAGEEEAGVAAGGTAVAA